MSAKDTSHPSPSLLQALAKRNQLDPFRILGELSEQLRKAAAEGNLAATMYLADRLAPPPGLRPLPNLGLSDDEPMASKTQRVRAAVDEGRITPKEAQAVLGILMQSRDLG